jgi:hypothetical protein
MSLDLHAVKEAIKGVLDDASFDDGSVVAVSCLVRVPACAYAYMRGCVGDCVCVCVYVCLRMCVGAIKQVLDDAFFDDGSGCVCV